MSSEYCETSLLSCSGYPEVLTNSSDSMSVCPTRGISSHNTPKTPTRQSKQALKWVRLHKADSPLPSCGHLDYCSYGPGLGTGASLFPPAYFYPLRAATSLSLASAFPATLLLAYRTWVLMPVTSAARPSSPPQIHTPLRSMESGLLFSEYWQRHTKIRRSGLHCQTD